MRKSGVNSNTPNDFMLGAGVVFKNFKYVYSEYTGEETSGAETIKLSQITKPGVSFIGTAEGYTPKAGDFVTGAWDDSEEHVLGATNGGNKLTITSELTPIDVDGATVKIKGLEVKTGESASLETNIAQLSVETLKRAIVGKEVSSIIPGYVQIETKSLIELSDYLDNIAYVGSMTDGTDIIAIMENAICTSGFEIEGKNKETAVVKTTFESTADFESGVYDKLPVYIFYPESKGKKIDGEQKIYQIVEG